MEEKSISVNVVLKKTANEVNADMMSVVLTEAELDAELDKGYADMIAGKTKPVRQTFASIRPDFGL